MDITTVANTVSNNMDSQERVLEKLLSLIDEAEKQNALEDVSETELQQLKDYAADMMLAVSTAKKLAANLKKKAKAEKKDKKEKEDKEKLATPKKSTKKKAEPVKEEAPAPKPTASEEDDDSFLDL